MLIRYTVPDNKILRYNVEINTINKAAKQIKNTLCYEYLISPEKGVFNNEVFSFVRNNLVLNRSNIQNPINEILSLSSEVYSNLLLQIDYKGDILKIKNLLEIKDRWTEMKHIINNSYKGDIVQRIIESIDKNMKEEQLIIASLYKDPFFFYYLRGIYANYKTKEFTFEGKLIDVIPHKSLSVLKINHLIIDSHTEQMYINSDYRLSNDSILSVEDYFREQGKNGNVNTKIEGKYQFSKDLTLEHMKSESIVYYESNVYRSKTFEAKLVNIENR